MVAQARNIDLANDSDLARRVRIFLASQARPALRGIDVNAADGTVTLRGRVYSYYEKQFSLSITSRVAGVHRLKDDLVVQTARYSD